MATSTLRTILLAVSSAYFVVTSFPLWAQDGKPVASPEVEGEGASLRGIEPSGPPRPAPRDAAGHPDLTGYWKPVKEPGKPGGNIGKDLPGFKLPFTPEGEKALVFNRTKTVDPEA